MCFVTERGKLREELILPHFYHLHLRDPVSFPFYINDVNFRLIGRFRPYYWHYNKTFLCGHIDFYFRTNMLKFQIEGCRGYWVISNSNLLIFYFLYLFTQEMGIKSWLQMTWFWKTFSHWNKTMNSRNLKFCRLLSMCLKSVYTKFQIFLRFSSTSKNSETKEFFTKKRNFQCLPILKTSNI